MRERESIFDKMTSDDIIMAFFPCTRFESQVQLWMRGDSYSQRGWSEKKKLEYSMKLFNECNENYQIISKLVMIALDRNLELIIENPYNKASILYQFWSVRPNEIDLNRHENGDYFKKPTMYYFINCNPHINLTFEGKELKAIKHITTTCNKVERSMISPDYARHFIKEKIL